MFCASCCLSFPVLCTGDHYPFQAGPEPTNFLGMACGKRAVQEYPATAPGRIRRADRFDKNRGGGLLTAIQLLHKYLENGQERLRKSFTDFEPLARMY